MMTAATARVLARCNGFTVVAGDEVVGAVATPVFSGTKLLPDYLLVRLAESVEGTYCAIPAALITDADPESETVVLEVSLDDLRVLPERDL
jgi:hypothetical protein